MHNVHVLAHGPRNDLIMQWDMTKFLSVNAQSLLDGFSPLSVVGFGLDLVDELIDFRIGITAVVEGAVSPFALAANQALQGVERIECRNAPAEQVGAGVEALHLGEVGGARHGV